MAKTNLIKRILAYTLVLSVVFSQMIISPVATVSAVDTDVAVWDGTKAENFAGGAGTQASPFLIETAEQLYKMVEEYHTHAASLGKYFKITNDIYLNDVVDGTSIVELSDKIDWLEGYGDSIPVHKENSFSGTLDGGNNTIYGLYVTGKKRGGLLPGITSYADIKNLKFDNLYITGISNSSTASYCGAIAGNAYWYDNNKTAKITNCSVVNSTIAGDVAVAGGLVGHMNDCTITFTNCYSYNLELNNWAIEGIPGGIVGKAYNSGKLHMVNCYSAGNFPTNSNVSKANCTNVYTDVAIPEGNTTAGVTVLTVGQMKGEAAKTNMLGLEFGWGWETVENSYPIITKSPVTVWDGKKASGLSAFAGSGTAADPYQIENASQLAYVVSTDLTDGLCFELVKDIRINDTTKANWKENSPNVWKWGNVRFVGTFDGNGHTIDGLYYSGSQYRMGLFSYVGANDTKTILTTIKNFKMTNAYINSEDTSEGQGIVAGQASQITTFEGIYIDENCELNAPKVSGVGGIIGRSAYNVSMTNCAVLANITGKGNVGAFAGIMSSGAYLTLKNSFSASNVSVQGVTDRNISTNCINVYATQKQGTVDAVVTQLTAEQMKGEAAKTNMPGLSFKYVWETVENGFPAYNPRGEIWDGSVATSYDDFEGSGTEKDPYLIENGAQLAYALIDGSIDGGYYFKLVKDIVLNDASYEGWQSFARPWMRRTNARFNCELDGDGHTIEGLYFNATSGGRYGLIAYIGKLESGNDHIATVKNIKFVGASITNTATSGDIEGAAVVAGQASGETIFENIIIDETSSVNAPNVKGVAGLVGRGYGEGKKAHVTIRNSAVLATLNGGSHIGAFGGTFWDPQLIITIDNSFADTTYGLIGDNKGTVAITNTYTNVLGNKDTGAVQVDSANMKGEAAKTNMPTLDFACVWQTTANDYPVLREKIFYGWDGTVATEFAGGTGTADDPYLIENGGQLYKMVAEFSNASVAEKSEIKTYFKITKDINLSNRQWYTISAKSWLDREDYNGIGFNGVIYGEGHTIYNLYNNTAAGAVGLIPVATQGAEIHDLHLENGTLPRFSYQTYACGALVGLAKGASSSKPIVIEGCSVKNFTISSCNGSAAFVGYLYSQSITMENNYCINNNLSHTEPSSANSAAYIGYTNGNDYGNKIVIKNSHSADIYPVPYLSEKFAAITTFENVYTSNATYDNSITGLTKLTAEQMTGAVAIENLDGFNFNQIWKCGAEGEYPIHMTNEDTALFWDGSAADDFAGGDGTAEKPYEISNAEELFKLANQNTVDTAGKYYKLTNDIVISRVYDGWETDYPYSWTNKATYFDGFAYGNSFAGTLDGAGYTVSGLYYNDEIIDERSYAYGLIPFVSANAVIKNLNVTDVVSNVNNGNGTAYVGAVAGAAHVTKEDIANAFKMVQFVGVNVQDRDVAILGGASRGVKFELCTADEFIGSESEKISIRNCNSDIKYTDDVLIYNSLNADSTTLTNIRKILLAKSNDYITDINGDSTFNIKDLVSAKKGLVMTEPEETLVWSQEFNGDDVDYTVLNKDTSMSVGSILKYADNAKIVDTGDTDENFDGKALQLYCTDTGETVKDNKIYSVNYGLSTVNTMSFKYGRLEMRAKLPFATGAWPSLWLTSRGSIGYDYSCDYSTEIDVFEIFGTNTFDKGELANNNQQMVACIHKWYNDENGKKLKDENGKAVECSCGTSSDKGNGYIVSESYRSKTFMTQAEMDAWHEIVFEWTEDVMTFSVDGDVYYTAKRDEMKDKFGLTDMNKDAAGIFEQFLCININNHMRSDVSGIDTSELNYEIDYIRLYQKNDGKSVINLK